MNQRTDWHLTGDIAHEVGRGDPYAAAIRATRMPMIITDPRQVDNPIIFANEAFQKLSGYGRDEVIGRNCRFLQGPDTDPRTVLALRESVESSTDINVDILNYRKDGSTFWNALYLSPVRGVDGDVQFFFASQLDVTDRIEAQRVVAEQKAIVEAEVKRRTAELEDALAAKTLLLNEVDHRVKNNLTMIGSLLRLQSRRIGDPEIVAKLDAMLERVDALANVHRDLYRSEDISRFDIGGFTASLVQDVVGSSGRSDIKVEADVQRVEIASNHASALGLIVNEIVTNAIKHAFSVDHSGTLKVSAKADASRGVIRLADDGHGISGDSADGLGRTLVKRLSRQVGASTDWASGKPGTVVTISFPLAPLS